MSFTCPSCGQMMSEAMGQAFAKQTPQRRNGKADLATANTFGSSVSVLLNTGNGTFRPKVDYATGPNPPDVAIGDLNGDGKADLATANGNDANTVSVLIGRGDGSFSAKVGCWSRPRPRISPERAQAILEDPQERGLIVPGHKVEALVEQKAQGAAGRPRSIRRRLQARELSSPSSD